MCFRSRQPASNTRQCCDVDRRRRYLVLFGAITVLEILCFQPISASTLCDRCNTEEIAALRRYYSSLNITSTHEEIDVLFSSTFSGELADSGLEDGEPSFPSPTLSKNIPNGSPIAIKDGKAQSRFVGLIKGKTIQKMYTTSNARIPK
jgi:hypothetical protein